MVILGIDPGTKRIGYGLIEKNKGGIKFVAAGLLKIKSTKNVDALRETKNQISAIIKKFRPQVLAIEKIYFVKNQKTGIQVAEARGVVIATAIEGGLAVREFGPNEIKAGITGYGLADKKAVLKMVKLILGKPDIDVIDDASDALAVAILSTRRSLLTG